MGILASEHEEKLAREKNGGGNDYDAETGHAADDGRVLPAKFSPALTARERRREHVGEEITENRKYHRQPAERTDLGDGTNFTAEDADEKNRDLALETKENGVRRLASSEASHRLAILRILRRFQIDDAGHISAQHPILQEQSGRAHGERDRTVEEKIDQGEQHEKTRHGASHVDCLNPADV